MSFLTKPLQIGAADLRRGVGYSHCGALHLQIETLLGRKWKQRYVIISKGCLYIYIDMYSRKPEKAISLTVCESATACENQDGDYAFCFRLFETDKKPLLFSCDTWETRKIWLEKLRLAIQETHPRLSTDSGYAGSASSVSGTAVGDTNLQTDSYMYVDQNNRDKKGQESLPVQASVEPTDDIHETVPKTYLHEAEPLRSIFTTASTGYFSVRGGSETISLEDSLLELGVGRRQESRLNQTTDLEDIHDDDNSSPEILYENPEVLVKKFTRENYQRETKKHVKRKMEGESEGTFVVYPGEDTKLSLCVMTPKGLKFFRIHEQEGLVSLFKDFSRAPDLFRTLDMLFSHYRCHDLPGDGYNVKLKKKLDVTFDVM